MIARISPSPNALAAACFPVPGCTVGGYATKTGYKLFISPPQPWAGPTVYCGNGATCYDALAAAVQLFHDTAHAYPAARPLAAAGSYCPPQQPQGFPADDEPQGYEPDDDETKVEWYEEARATSTCPKCEGSGTNHHELHEPGKWIRSGDIHECYECEGLGRVAA